MRDAYGFTKTKCRKHTLQLTACDADVTLTLPTEFTSRITYSSLQGDFYSLPLPTDDLKCYGYTYTVDMGAITEFTATMETSGSNTNLAITFNGVDFSSGV